MGISTAAGPVAGAKPKNEFRLGEGIVVSQLLVDRGQAMAGAVGGDWLFLKPWRVLRPGRTDWIFYNIFEIGRINQLSSE